ncbi:MAG TPA: succinylglutamate desuccinylase/aspartoacylase family protein [Candidatus Dormibacteraeota bacterium]|nr:succinylglutamate desuccinylase/aspartoacylase family protein [Candidatus Dormibacteraeota bacterium]
MSRVSVVGLSPHVGELSRGMVGVPGLRPPWEVPVVVARGRQVGPTRVVTSGVQAAEYVPIEAVTQFSRQLDLELLRGTFIAVLIVNMPGFYERTIYVNHRDGKNINRVFPGSPTGSASERVADFLVREVIDGADAYIDASWGCFRGLCYQDYATSMPMPKRTSVDDFFAQLSDVQRPHLEALRELSLHADSEAREELKWNLPMYVRGEKTNLWMLQNFKYHCSLRFSPPFFATQKTAVEAAGYEAGEGFIKLPYDRELPTELLAALTRARVEEYDTTGAG